MKYKNIKYEDWQQEGLKLFGTEDVKQWKFVCPGCGNVQSCESLNKQYTGLEGYFFATIFCRCVGWIDKDAGCRTALDEKEGARSPIKITVDDEHGLRTFPIFDFARPKPEQETEIKN